MKRDEIGKLKTWVAIPKKLDAFLVAQWKWKVKKLQKAMKPMLLINMHSKEG